MAIDQGNYFPVENATFAAPIRIVSELFRWLRPPSNVSAIAAVIHRFVDFFVDFILMPLLHSRVEMQCILDWSLSRPQEQTDGLPCATAIEPLEVQ